MGHRKFLEEANDIHNLLDFSCVWPIGIDRIEVAR